MGNYRFLFICSRWLLVVGISNSSSYSW